jgi:hypothetical protein
VRFGSGESKEEIARPYFEQAEREGRFGVVLIGVAQERAWVWAGWRAGGPDGHPHFAFGWQSRLPNYYYLSSPAPAAPLLPQPRSTVFRSQPVWRAIALIDQPRRYSAKISTSSSRVSIPSGPSHRRQTQSPRR